LKYWLAAPLMLCATPALADWQYTRWGMSPQDVVAASNGTARAVQDEKRKRVRKMSRLAVGQVKEGDTTFEVEFYFDNQKLRLIRYQPTGGMDCDGEEAALLKHFGPAATDEAVRDMPGANKVQLRARERVWRMPSGDQLKFNIMMFERPDLPQVKPGPLCSVLIEPAPPAAATP